MRYLTAQDNSIAINSGQPMTKKSQMKIDIRELIEKGTREFWDCQAEHVKRALIDHIIKEKALLKKIRRGKK